jgi:hypothetical protein
MKDYLDKIYKKELNDDEAESIYNMALDNAEVTPWWQALGMNTIEEMAYLHGAGFSEIAVWRHEGWPDKCIYCGNKIDHWEGGWTVKHDGKMAGLVHIDCLP